MKATKLIKLIATVSLSLGTISPLLAVDNSAKREVYNNKKGSVYGIKGLLKISATIQGQLKNQDFPIWANATCIGDGMLVTAYSSLSPSIGGKNPNFQITKELDSLKIINASGEEFDAKLILHDEDLDLAFIALDPKGENAKNWKGQVIDISKDVDLKHLDETINIGRSPSQFRYQSSVTIGNVSAILKKPRKLYRILSAVKSAPSFTNTGKFIGITVLIPTEGKKALSLTIPAKYIRKLVKQATTKQAELKK